MALAGAVGRSANRRRVLAGRGDERMFTASDGNRLAYRVQGDDTTGEVVYLLESGLLSTAGHWEWVASELAKTGAVVTYSRAGYGRSTHRPGTALVLDDLVTAASELTETVAGGRPVVLVGHSLGGYLALLTAERTTADVRGVALVDSSHPEELERSTRQAQGAEGLTQTFPLMIHSLDLGLGLLLPVPDWARALPAAAQPTVLAEYRDSRIWRAARREWAATLRSFSAPPDLPGLAVPVLSLSAERTADQDPVHGELQEELVKAGTGGRYEMVPGADHDSILTTRELAVGVARTIAAFAADQLGSAARAVTGEVSA